jgi:hypothetical protein
MVTAATFRAVPGNAARLPDCRGLPHSSSSREPRRTFEIGNLSVGTASDRGLHLFFKAANLGR